MSTYLKHFFLIVFSLNLLIFSNILFADETVIEKKNKHFEPIIECRVNDGEVVLQHSVKDIYETYGICSTKSIAEFKDAKEVIKSYWESSYKKRYDLYSVSYKKVFKQIYNINNSDEYYKHFPVSERTWQKQVYTEIVQHSQNSIQITVLSTWYEEGYHGVMTFIFDLLKENERWSISNIVF